MMDNNFGKCRLIFTILSPFESSENSLMYIITKIFPHLQYVATQPCENKNPEMLLTSTASSINT